MHICTKSSHISKQEEQIRKIGALIVEGTVEGMKLPFRRDVVDGARLQMEPGTTGGSKIWLGKDYSNPVNRDFFEVNKPFEGNERYTVEPPCATISLKRPPPISDRQFKTPKCRCICRCICRCAGTSSLKRPLWFDSC